MCAVCLNEVCVAVGLSCGHRFCRECLRQCAYEQLEKCPKCRRLHILDPEILESNAVAYRSSYRDWRSGKLIRPPKEVDAVTKPSKRLLPVLTTCSYVGMIS